MLKSKLTKNEYDFERELLDMVQVLSVGFSVFNDPAIRFEANLDDLEVKIYLTNDNVSCGNLYLYKRVKDRWVYKLTDGRVLSSKSKKYTEFAFDIVTLHCKDFISDAIVYYIGG